MAEPQPRFVLDLSNEGITLWQRASGGEWSFLGQVPLEAPDMAAQLKMLRIKTGVTHSAPLKTIVRIPRSEVLITRLKLGMFEGDAALKQARKLIDELTPYSLEELVYDLQAKGVGNMAPVAVVARTTLMEAEEFARSHGFQAQYFTTGHEAREFPAEPVFYLKEPRKSLMPVISRVAAVMAIGLSVGYFSYTYYFASEPQTAPPAEIATVLPAPEPQTTPAADPVPEQPEPPAQVADPDHAPDFSAPQTATLRSPDTTPYPQLAIGRVGRTSLAHITRLARPIYQKGNPAPATPGNPPPRKTDALALADALRDLPQVRVNDDSLETLQAEMAMEPVDQGSNGTSVEVAAYVPPEIAFDDIYSSQLDSPVLAFQAPPRTAAANPDPPPPPPPYLSAEPGTLEPTPEGTPGPENIRIYAGPPPVLARARPVPETPADPLADFRPRLRPQGLVSEELLAALVPQAAPEPQALPTPNSDAPPPAPASQNQQPFQLASLNPALRAPDLPDTGFSRLLAPRQPLTLLEQADPALAGIKAPARPAGLAPAPVDEPDTAETETPAQEPDLLALADPALAGIKARNRPENLAPAAPVGLLALADPALSGKQAKQRPRDLKPEPAQEPETPANTLQNATRLAVARSVIPKLRPANLGPGLAVPNEQNTKATAKTPRSAAGSSKPSPSPTTVVVARAATEKSRINKRKMNLIGVFGTPSSRRALVRMPSGRYIKVKTGDRLSGWQVSAIGESSLRIRKGTKDQILRMP